MEELNNFYNYEFESPILPDDWKEGEDFFNISQDVNENNEHRDVRDAQTEAESQPAEKIVNSADEPLQSAEEIERLREDINTTKRLYPDFKEVPEEVANAVADGSHFLPAYAAYRAREAVQALESLRREVETLKQNQDMINRAPVRSVSGVIRNQPVSDFERGFDADMF